MNPLDFFDTLGDANDDPFLDESMLTAEYAERWRVVEEVHDNDPEFELCEMLPMDSVFFNTDILPMRRPTCVKTTASYGLDALPSRHPHGGHFAAIVKPSEMNELNDALHSGWRVAHLASMADAGKSMVVLEYVTQ